MRKIALEEHIGDASLTQLDKRLQDMDENGVEIQVLTYHVLSKGVKSTDSVEEARRTNDLLLRPIEKYPNRFRAFANLPIGDAEGAARELERCVRELGYLGGVINLGADYLDDPKFEPVYQTAETLDVPIYLHPGNLPASLIGDFEGYPGLSRALFGFATHTGLQALRMILSGVFDQHPELKIILGHMGEGLPYWLWRMDSRFQGERRLSKETDAFYSGLKKLPSEYFLQNFYSTTSGMFWYPPLQCAVEACGADRILFAVDYPYESIVDASTFIDTAPISEAERAKICYENAERLLKVY